MICSKSNICISLGGRWLSSQDGMHNNLDLLNLIKHGIGLDLQMSEPFINPA